MLISPEPVRESTKLPPPTAHQSRFPSVGVYGTEPAQGKPASENLVPASHGKRKYCKYNIGYTNKNKRKSVQIEELLDRSVQHPQGYQDHDSICEEMARQAAKAYENGYVKSYSVYTHN